MTIEKLIELGVDKDTAEKIAEYAKSETDELNEMHRADTEKLKKEKNELIIGMRIGKAIAEANVWSEKAVYAMMNFDNISVSDNGEVYGVDEEIARIKRECAVLFKETAVPRVIKSAHGVPVRDDDAVRAVMGI